MFNGSVHGATLTKESASVVIEVITSVQALATTFLEIEDSGERARSGEDWLVRTGAIHALIEMARSNDGLPKDNLAAVRRHWLKDAGALEDGVREVGEMIEDAQNETETDEDDGWDELGIEPSQPLTEEELKRTKKVLSVLRLCNLLHQKVITEILSTSSSTWANSVLDELAPLSPALLSACDELVSTLDSPQEADSVKTELDALKGVIDRIRDRLSLLYNHPDSTALLDGVSLNQTIPTNRRNPMEKWFNTCFDQILKAIQLAAGPSNVGTES
ncbi:hypothetical protein BT96DRAFT_123056 [Gymnopus androsaceus JB14]|uniref:Uncharacterized protein n=1 Tax=Gymnopus androsaceus JB14 TaxID=1447944 RepID=A0A6A4HCK8_9AGAR|nr:hypothetical protein BT96DRAFT_123056 [Gymnopus androsaceus JB14]